MRKIIVICLLAFLYGCVSTLRTAPDFDQVLSNFKTIAVMPPDIEVYKITAGGVRELIDQWSDETKKFTIEALEEHLGQRYGYKVNFISEEWLKSNHKEKNY